MSTSLDAGCDAQMWRIDACMVSPCLLSYLDYLDRRGERTSGPAKRSHDRLVTSVGRGTGGGNRTADRNRKSGALKSRTCGAATVTRHAVVDRHTRRTLHLQPARRSL